MHSEKQLSISSFSKGHLVLPLQNISLYKDNTLRKCLKISSDFVKPVYQPVFSNSPLKKLSEKKVHMGTSSFKTISRTHFYSSIKKTESKTDFYNKSYSVIDKHIRNIKILKPIAQRVKRNDKIKDSFSTEQSCGLAKSISLIEVEKSIDCAKQVAENPLKKKKKFNIEDIIRQQQESSGISGLSCYSLKKEAILKKIIEMY